jgi:hypothetical protein
MGDASGLSGNDRDQHVDDLDYDERNDNAAKPVDEQVAPQDGGTSPRAGRRATPTSKPLRKKDRREQEDC